MLKAGEAHAALRRLPVATLPELTRGARPLVLAPHPDDESLGCGGLLAQAAAAGLRPGVVVLTDGAGSHPGSRRFPPARLRAMREAEARAAVAVLGVEPERIAFFGLPDTAAPRTGAAFEAAVAALVTTARDWHCELLLAPWRHDPHCDHEAAHLLAAAVARQVGLRHLAYPVWGWTLDAGAPLSGPGVAGWRLDVSGQRALKRRAVASHRSQYAGVVDDDPAGFQLDAGFLSLFEGEYEFFLSDP